MSTINHYNITIRWSAEDECFIAEVPALPGVTADGDTIEEAAREIRIALEAALEPLETRGFPLPEPDQALEALHRFRAVVNVSALARKAGLNKNTLATKLRRGTRLTGDEAKRITAALNS